MPLSDAQFYGQKPTGSLLLTIPGVNAPLPTYNAGAGTLGTPGNLTPSAPSGYNPAYGGKPEVPDPAAVAKAAYEANLKHQQLLMQLEAKKNAENYAFLMSQIRSGFPEYDLRKGQASTTIGANLSGDISQGTTNALLRGAAERGIYAPGTTNAAYLAAVYDTAENLKNQGLQGYNAMLAGVPRVNPVDYSGMMLDPNQLFSAQLLANTIAASPDPTAKAAEEFAKMLDGLKAGYRGTAPTGWSDQSQTYDMLNKLLSQYSKQGGGAAPVVAPSGGGGDSSAYYNPAITGGSGNQQQYNNVFGDPSTWSEDWWADWDTVYGNNDTWSEDWWADWDQAYAGGGATGNYGGQSPEELFPGFLPETSEDYYYY